MQWYTLYGNLSASTDFCVYVHHFFSTPDCVGRYILVCAMKMSGTLIQFHMQADDCMLRRDHAAVLTF